MSRTEAELIATAEEVRRCGGEVVHFVLDVSSVQLIREQVDAAAKTWGRIDVLVNSAGGTLGAKPAIEVTEEDWKSVHDRNLKGAFFVCQAVGKHMIANKTGSIVNISSAAGSRGRVNGSVYGASKGGLDALTRMLAAEWGPFGITVNGIAPSYVRTPLTEKSFADPAKLAPILQRTPLGRFPEVVDVAEAAVFLASNAGRNISGVILPIDGARTSSA
jgi:NAD(P)-dependent dehydrogenase (short-subunit alcohol dehydrogenase family)